MAAKKNKNERIILEDIDLKPQVIGYTYKKKSNIGRVIFIFVIFLLAVIYINDISVFINGILGKKTAETIGSLSGNNNESNKEKENIENEIVYNVFGNALEIKEDSFTLNNFNLNYYTLTFNVVNTLNTDINLSDKLYFIELFSENKTLLERHKLDIESIVSGGSVSYEYNVKSNFYYIVLVEKTIEDYPVLTLNADEAGNATLTCTKNTEKIVYTFLNDELTKINHTINESKSTATSYYLNYNSYQTKATKYSSLSGITAMFNSTLEGYNAAFSLDLINVNLNEIEEKYYYGYKTLSKVVNFEMETYGFTCN